VSFGFRLREARLHNKLTQGQLGKKVGLSASSIGGYEKGLNYPGIEYFAQLASVLSVDANYFYQDMIPSHNMELNGDEVELVKLYRGTEDYARVAVKKLLSVTQIKPLDEEEYEEILVHKSPHSIDFINDLKNPDSHTYLYIKNKHVPKAAAAGAYSWDDSMSPVVNKGDIMWLNDGDYKHDDICIFAIMDKIVCRRIQLNPQGELVGLLAENPLFESFTEESLEHCEFRAKLIGVMRQSDMIVKIG